LDAGQLQSSLHGQGFGQVQADPQGQMVLFIGCSLFVGASAPNTHADGRIGGTLQFFQLLSG
jgi:hypothetical protein